MAKFSHPCPTEAELISLADWPTLDAWEMADLIQGFCPRQRDKQFKSICWLSNYEYEISVFRKALQTGELAPRASPAEFVLWACLHNIPLPERFVDAVLVKIFILRRPVRPDRFNEEWVRTEQEQGAQPSKVALRGYDSVISQRARNFALAYVKRHGTIPPKGLLDKELAASMELPRKKVSRAYSMEMLFTENELRRAKRAYRRKFHQDKEET